MDSALSALIIADSGSGGSSPALYSLSPGGGSLSTFEAAFAGAATPLLSKILINSPNLFLSGGQRIWVCATVSPTGIAQADPATGNPSVNPAGMLVSHTRPVLCLCVVCACGAWFDWATDLCAGSAVAWLSVARSWIMTTRTIWCGPGCAVRQHLQLLRSVDGPQHLFVLSVEPCHVPCQAGLGSPHAAGQHADTRTHPSSHGALSVLFLEMCVYVSQLLNSTDPVSVTCVACVGVRADQHPAYLQRQYSHLRSRRPVRSFFACLVRTCWPRCGRLRHRRLRVGQQRRTSQSLFTVSGGSSSAQPQCVLAAWRL